MQQRLQPLTHILIIDGDYLKIGMNQANQLRNQFFPLDKEGNFPVFIKFLEEISGHQFNEIRYVSAEDNDTIAKNRRFYEELRRC